MRVPGTDCECFFKALFKSPTYAGWQLSTVFFKNKEEAVEHAKHWGLNLSDESADIQWPAEIDPSGYVMVPDSVE